MAVDEIHIDASPERIFEVLSDRRRYADWVVGTKDTAEWTGDWPEPGSTLTYTIAGPVRLSNRTVVRDVRPPHCLHITAKAGPMPDVAITIELSQDGPGTRLRMHERPESDVANLLLNHVGHFLLSRRNKVALDRLRRLAEAR